MLTKTDQEQKERAVKRAVYIRKWLPPLFWLHIANLLTSFMKKDFVLERSPSVYLAGQILNIACVFFYGFVLLKLSKEEYRYRTAGICAVIAAAANLLVLFIYGSVVQTPWALIITFPAAIVQLWGEYNEFDAHSFLLMGVDKALSDEWTLLWKWYVGCLLALLVSIYIIANSLNLGVIVTIVIALALLGVMIAKAIYLYRTAEVFKEGEGS
jgi:hypothetical protein